MAIMVNLSGLLCPSACGVWYVPYWQHLQVTYMTRAVSSSILFKIIIIKWIKSLFLFKKEVYILNKLQNERLKAFFIRATQTGFLSRRTDGDFCVECCSAAALILRRAHAVQNTLPASLGGGASCSSWCAAACWDGKLRLRCIFILYIFVYINYIAMFWTQILLYLLVSVSYKHWSIAGDFYFYFFL